MEYPFEKYQGAGNDFVMIDDREVMFPENDKALIAAMCDRHFGIGADGLILLRTHSSFEYEMIYFNSDGARSTFCGNGSRALARFANNVMIIPPKGEFLASDGVHSYELGADISVSMNVPGRAEVHGDDFVIDTGSPHYVHFVQNIEEFDIVTYGRDIRYSKDFSTSGINVNAVEVKGNQLHLRTYERGVENETLACGTGVTAAALVYAQKENILAGEIPVESKGGSLKVKFERIGDRFANVILTGPAERIFSGVWKR
jgi:diaminopimelate epimerase